MSFVDDLIAEYRDLDRRLSRIERLDVNPPASAVTRYSGTPVAGQLAIWSGAGTVFGTATFGTATIGVLALANTWTNQNQFNPINTTGVGLGVTRNLTATSTDSAVVSIVQQHTGDDQNALEISQSGAGRELVLKHVNGGAIIEVFRDDATIVAGNTIGLFRFVSNDTDLGADTAVATIAASAISTFSATSAATALVFNVTKTNAIVTTEALRLDENAAVIAALRLLVGLTSANATTLGILAGSSSNDAAVGGTLDVDTGQTGNVGAGEDVLSSYSVPANTLSANGMSLWFEASGTCAANLNAKTLRVRFGTSGTSQILSATVTGSGGGGVWSLRGRVIRTGAATQKGYCMLVGTNITAVSGVATGLNQTLSGAVTLEVTGEAVSNNDIVIETFNVGWDDNNT